MSRPLPDLTESDTAEFWKACAEHRFTYQVCRSCGSVVFFPRAHCPACGATDLLRHTSKGRGVVYTFTVIRTHHDPWFRTRVPFVTALIDLDEGIRLVSELLTDDVSAVRIGQPVTLDWEHHDNVDLPIFRPHTGESI